MTRKSFTRQHGLPEQSNKGQKPAHKKTAQQAAHTEIDNLPPAGNRREAVNILQMQTVVGNQAVGQFLTARSNLPSIQRDGEDESKPLSEAQAIRALSYYRGQPRDYTPDIIMQIQTAVGKPPTGTMTTEDVQAVAVWQTQLNETETPVLKVDGMAGPRTLPTLFRTGLAVQSSIESYSGKARELLAKWEELGTAEARINKLTELVNVELAAANVPAVGTIISDAEGNLGQFEFTSWSIDIGKPAFETANPTPAEKADMADTVYHESRHAEQWYRIAQFQASEGKSAQKITDDTDIPKKITDQAVANPLKKGSMEALIAKGWNESVYGSRADYRESVLKELAEAEKAEEKAQEELNADPTPANQKKLEAAKARHVKALAAYYDLPEENDANRIGARVTKAYMAKETEAEVVAP